MKITRRQLNKLVAESIMSAKNESMHKDNEQKRYSPEEIYGKEAVYIVNRDIALLQALIRKNGEIYDTDIVNGTIEFENGRIWQNYYNPADYEGRN
jgi:hypothetical protein